jgi:hypothetical protein
MKRWPESTRHPAAQPEVSTIIIVIPRRASRMRWKIIQLRSNKRESLSYDPAFKVYALVFTGYRPQH